MSAIDPLGGGGRHGGDGLSTPENIIDPGIKLAEVKKDESEDRINESTMLLASALVYSREPADRQRGIAILEDSLTNSGRVFQEQQVLYLLAVGYHQSEDYATSMRYLDRCLEIEPNWKAALSLKKTIEEQRARARSFYELAVDYYKSLDYPMSMHNLDLCLEIEPNCEEALSLKDTIEKQRAGAQSLYLLAVEYYESLDYKQSMYYLDLCLEIEDDCEEALSLKNIVEKELAPERSLYRFAVECYESGDNPKSMHYLDQYLEIEPDCEEALSLKKTIASEIETNSGKPQSLKKTIEEKYARLANSEKAQALKKTIEEKYARFSNNLPRVADSWTGIGIAVGGAAAVGGVAAVYGTGVVGGMAAAVAVRRGLVCAATTGAIFAAKKMADSASSAMKK